MMPAVQNSRADLAPALRPIQDLSWRLLGCDAAYAVSLLVAQLWLGLLWFFYQGFGITRGIIFCCFLVGLIFLRFFPRSASSPHPAGANAMTPLLKFLLVATVVADLAMMAVSSATSLETSKIPMDEGQTSWRAARLLWHDQNPYASGALVDFSAYRSRMPQRQNAGFRPILTQQDAAAALAHYDSALDPRIRDRLIPGQQGPTAQRESRLYGYKYGPVILVATAAIIPFGYPGGVLILNGVICFALFAIMWAILRKVSGTQVALAGAAMLALLLDRHITRNYLDRSATDVWALFFGSLAVLAILLRRPKSAAIATAFAVGCKTVPGLLFVPLLLRCRSAAPLLVFLIVLGAIYLPWYIWDSQGLLFNAILWPLYMATDFTSWQFYAPQWGALAARAIILVALGVLWLRYVFGKEGRLFWTLAVSGTLVLLASGFLRNGYVPWVSLWAVAAIAEAFVARSAAANGAEHRAFAP
jgi:hypothetical protein